MLFSLITSFWGPFPKGKWSNDALTPLSTCLLELFAIKTGNSLRPGPCTISLNIEHCSGHLTTKNMSKSYFQVILTLMGVGGNDRIWKYNAYSCQNSGPPFINLSNFLLSFLTQTLSIHYMTGRLLSVENTEKPEDKRNFQYFVLHLSFNQINQAPSTHPSTILLYQTPKSALCFLVMPTRETFWPLNNVPTVLQKCQLDSISPQTFPRRPIWHLGITFPMSLV